MKLPTVEDDAAFALEVTGDSMLPLYRAGDVIICSPEASVRRGDRVVVKTRDGEVMAKELRRRTAKTIELASLNPCPAGGEPCRTVPSSASSEVRAATAAPQH